MDVQRGLGPSSSGARNLGGSRGVRDGTWRDGDVRGGWDGLGGGIGEDELGGLDENLRVGGSEAIEAVLEVKAKGGGVGGVAKLEQEGVGGAKEAVDGGIVGGGAEVGDELREEGGLGQGEVVGTGDGERLGELRMDVAGDFEHRGDNEGFDLVLLGVWNGGGGGSSEEEGV